MWPVRNDDITGLRFISVHALKQQSVLNTTTRLKFGSPPNETEHKMKPESARFPECTFKIMTVLLVVPGAALHSGQMNSSLFTYSVSVLSGPTLNLQVINRLMQDR